MTDKPDICCETCGYFQSFKNMPYGECRRNPPTVTSDDQGMCNYAWPGVNKKEGWCGEHSSLPVGELTMPKGARR